MKNLDIKFKESLQQNIATYEMWCNRICEIALSVFSWENLPETIDSRYIENLLLFNGACVFFKDNELDFLCLPTTFGKYDKNYRPQEMTAYAVTGYNKPLTSKNAVICFSNFTRIPLISWVNHYAMKLYEIDRIFDVNLRSTKQPLVISCESKDKLSFKNAYMEYDGNEPVIFTTKGFDTNNFKVLAPNTNFILDKIREEKTHIYQEMLDFFGVPIYPVKKERLITDETTTARTQASANILTSLQARQNFCARVNEMFNLNLSVKYNFSEV